MGLLFNFQSDKYTCCEIETLKNDQKILHGNSAPWIKLVFESVNSGLLSENIGKSNTDQ